MSNPLIIGLAALIVLLITLGAAIGSYMRFRVDPHYRGIADERHNVRGIVDEIGNRVDETVFR